MAKRIAASLCCLMLVFQLAQPQASAGDQTYFLALSNEVQPVSDQTMPFWSGGYLYIPASIFTGTARKVLGVSYTYVESEQIAILYDDSGHLLMFGLRDNHAVDENGNTSVPGAKRRSGLVYVPVALVARTFGLEYSVIDVPEGHLVWVRQQGFGLTDREFANAAAYQIASRYAAYQKEKESQTVPEPPPAAEEDPVVTGKRIYLCLTAGPEIRLMLDTLDRYQSQAAFFCPPEFLEENGGLLRRMDVTGQSVGILADASLRDRSLEEQLEAGNRALEQATLRRTRLCRIRNGSSADREAARALGYRVLEPELDRSPYGLRGTAQAGSLLRQVSARRGSVTVWLGDSASAAGLRAFLSAADSGDGRCLAWTETA